MTPLHTQILTARDRNGQELRTIQKQLQKLPPGKLICSRNRTTVKWYQGDGHSKTYIPKANRTLAEQLALKKYLQQQEQILLQEQAAITAYLKYSPAGSLSSDDPHLLSDPACEDLLRSYSSTSKNIPDISNVSDIPNILTRSAVEWSARFLRTQSAPSRAAASQNRLRREGAFQIGSHDCHAAPPKRHSLPLRMCALPWRHHSVSGFHHTSSRNRRTLLLGAFWSDGRSRLRKKRRLEAFSLCRKRHHSIRSSDHHVRDQSISLKRRHD